MKGSSLPKEGEEGGRLLGGEEGGRLLGGGGGRLGSGGGRLLGGGGGRLLGGEGGLLGSGGGRLLGGGGGRLLGGGEEGGRLGSGWGRLGSGGGRLLGVGGGGGRLLGDGGGGDVNNEKRVNDFDDLLESVGGMGRYQVLLIALVLIPVSFFSGYSMRHCNKAPHLTNTNTTAQVSKEGIGIGLVLLEDSGEFSSCKMYRWIPDKDNNNNNNGSHYVITNVTQVCVNGWEYDQSQFTSTVATSFDWVCDKVHYSPLLLSTFMIGNTVGTFFLPILADKVLGRCVVFYLSLAIHVVFTAALTLVTTLPLHLLLRFLSGLAFESYYLMPFIICLELTPVSYRALDVMLSFIAWTFGMCSVSLMAWLVPRWKFLALSTCIPGVLGFCYWSHCTFLVYGVLLLGINVLPDSSVLSHFILSLSELPSNFIGGSFVHFLGRRFSYIFTFLIIGVLLIFAPFTVHNPWLLLFTLGLIKLFSTQGLYVIFVMVSEIFPTPVRTAGTGITLVFGMLGMVLAPQILHAQEYFGGNFKFYLMLGVTVVCLVVCLPLPETLGLPLPQTFEDGENLGRRRPFTKWIHHWNQKDFPAYNSTGGSRQASSFSQDPRSCQERSSFIAKA
ncbi:hypothetical protein Pcinc_035705 [Petrolisthes cinctipes]|uniref:Major facilitator superfamily (MFS) profile domain-containing protein n=1 Tax=Petrolisthes cinctipes TaxID=88211 RepID=A0AAE1BW08_PETCI|nr:hypothetical protein Pcinc_035705 [Petrolisthes cinctipes]